MNEASAVDHSAMVTKNELNVKTFRLQSSARSHTVSTFSSGKLIDTVSEIKPLGRFTKKLQRAQPGVRHCIPQLRLNQRHFNERTLSEQFVTTRNRRMFMCNAKEALGNVSCHRFLFIE